MGGATLAAAIAGTTGGAGAGVFDLSEGAGTISIPSGFTSLTIEVWGGGGGGGFGTSTLGLLRGAGFLFLSEEATGFNRIGQG